MSQYTPGYKTNLNTNRIETLLASLVSSQRKILFTDEGIPLAAPGDITVVNITGDITATVNGSTLTLSVTGGGGEFLPLVLTEDTTVTGTNKGLIFEMVENDGSYRSHRFRITNTVGGEQMSVVMESFQFRVELEDGGGNSFQPLKLEPGSGDYVLGDNTYATMTWGIGKTSNGSKLITSAISVIDDAGNVVITIPVFAGGGTRMVTADNNGELSVQAIPGGVPTSRTINGLDLSDDRNLPGGVLAIVRSGLYYSNNITQTDLTTGAIAANSLRAYPFLVSRPITINEMKSEVTTNVALTSYRIGIYTDNGSGYPDALVANSDTGTYDSTSNGVKTGTPASNLVLTTGLYWIVVNANGAPTMRCHNRISLPSSKGLFAVMGSGNQPTGWVTTLAYTNMPANYPAGATETNTLCPAVLLRAV